MIVLFDGDVRVEYGYVHVDSGVGGWDQDLEARAGQRNGLLGAAQPGFLVVSTGMHTGLVPFRVEAHDHAPPLADGYGEIVEASCDLRGPELWLTTFDWGTSFVLPGNGPHRVRLSARHYEAGRKHERYKRKQRVRDSYLLQFWPAVMAPDQIVKVKAPSAQYWHTQARQQPDAPVSPYDVALAEQRERADVVEQHEAFERASTLQRWGGRDPSPRLLEVQRHALALTRERRDLVDAIAALPADRQRALAVRLARQACAADAGPLDWRPALEALSGGRPLPAPFDDERALHARLFPTSATVSVTSTVTLGPVGVPPRQPLHTGVSAAAAVRAAAATDPLAAALRAVDAASWSVPDHDAYFADVGGLVR